MPRKKDERPEPVPTHKIMTDKQARELLKVEEIKILQDRINELTNLLWRREGAGQEEINLLATRALEHFNSLKPADGAEGMLAQQMVGTHFAALECLRRAAIPNQTFEGRDQALKHASKLMALYARQLETLNKHRGKGQQKVTVEHVRVEKGGQAIVGNVETSGRRNTEATPPELEHKVDTSVPLELAKAKKAPSGKRK